MALMPDRALRSLSDRRDRGDGFYQETAEISPTTWSEMRKTSARHSSTPLKSSAVAGVRTSPAKKSEDETADGADDAGDHLAEMGAAGEDAGNQIKEAISGAVKAFVGFEAIKSGIELLKQFGAGGGERIL